MIMIKTQFLIYSLYEHAFASCLLIRSLKIFYKFCILKDRKGGMAKRVWFWNNADKDGWKSYFSLDLFAKPYLLDFNDRS